MASGHAMTGVFEGTHWDPKRAAQGKKVNQIYIGFDTIVDPELSPKRMIPYTDLKEVSSTYHWSPYASGVSIPDDVADKLENVWINTAI